MLHFY
ncbi:hypothetical protein D043_3860A, partial [Vibrio parahaemolyticus EKP-021]